MTTVSVVDYGLANIRSVVNALSCFEVDVEIAESGAALADADRIVLPGVGSFDAGMRGLRERGHEEALERRVVEDGTPFLGVCLGLQFLFEASEEGNETGLGWIAGTVTRFPDGEGKPKVPHMGWDSVTPARENILMRELEPPVDFYFVHSFYAPDDGAAGEIATGYCDHGMRFVAALERDNICAVQFHPEKSQLAGMKLLETFIRGPW